LYYLRGKTPGRQKIKHLEKNPFETRAFAYLDIISWVESKVYNKTMSEIIREKNRQAKKRKERKHSDVYLSK
jgi:hypothetical protein